MLTPPDTWFHPFWGFVYALIIETIFLNMLLFSDFSLQISQGIRFYFIILSSPTTAKLGVTPRPVKRRFRPFGHAAFMIMRINILHHSWIKLIKPLRDNTCQIHYGYMCTWTDSQTKSTFLSQCRFYRPWAAIYPPLPPGEFCKGIFFWKPIQNEPC